MQNKSNEVLLNSKKQTPKKSKSKMLANYFDNCIYIYTAVFLADVFVRLFKMFREYFFFAKYYLPDQRLWHIFKRVYVYNHCTIILLVIALLAALLRSHFTTHIPLLPPVSFLTFIPLYWIYYGVNFSYSPLDYAYWIREPHTLDYATGMASNYFHGYLNLTIPSYRGHLGIRERIELYEAEHQVQFAMNRLVILMPNIMFIKPLIESNFLERAKPLETIMKNRAGVERLFKNEVYRLNIPVNGTHYYIALEGATPLLSFYEATHSTLSTTWQMQEMSREILFRFYYHLKKLIYECQDTRDEVEIIMYDSQTSDGRTQDVGKVVLAYITNAWRNNKELEEK